MQKHVLSLDPHASCEGRSRMFNLLTLMPPVTSGATPDVRSVHLQLLVEIYVYICRRVYSVHLQLLVEYVHLLKVGEPTSSMYTY